MPEKNLGNTKNKITKDDYEKSQKATKKVKNTLTRTKEPFWHGKKMREKRYASLGQ